MGKKVKSKKGLIIGIVVGILVVCCAAFGLVWYLSQSVVVDLKMAVTVNVFDEFYNTDPVKKIEEGKLKSKKEKVDTSKIGKQKIVLEFEDKFHRIRKKAYMLHVVDEEAPVITFTERLGVIEGSSLDLESYATVTDNSREEIKVLVEGEVDYKTPGSYELYYVAKDSSGNEAKEKFFVDVHKKEVVVSRDNYVEPDHNFTTSNGHKGVVKNGVTYIDGILIANKTYALPSTYNPGGLTSETLNAFTEMQSAASAEGIRLDVISGFRSYSYQKGLYNRYVSQDGKAAADTYSARAGHSEHQTGLAFDVNRIDYNMGKAADGIWLNNNAYKYGFILRYPEGKTGETGYVYEPWHFRYVGKELAPKLYNSGNWITLESYFGITSQYNY